MLAKLSPFSAHWRRKTMKDSADDDLVSVVVILVVWLGVLSGLSGLAAHKIHALEARVEHLEQHP